MSAIRSVTDYESASTRP